MHYLPDAFVRSGHDLKEMAVRILEIYASATVVPVDFARALFSRVGPVLDPSITDTGEHLIEFVFAY
jgi:hypothetical protein